SNEWRRDERIHADGRRRRVRGAAPNRMYTRWDMLDKRSVPAALKGPPHEYSRRRHARSAAFRAALRALIRRLTLEQGLGLDDLPAVFVAEAVGRFVHRDAGVLALCVQRVEVEAEVR